MITDFFLKLAATGCYVQYVLSGKRKAIDRLIRSIDLDQLDSDLRDALKHCCGVSSALADPNDFDVVAMFLDTELTPYKLEFVSQFDRDQVPYSWIVTLGLYVGDFVTRHSKDSCSWAVDDHERPVIVFARESGSTNWNPFSFVERHFFASEPSSIYTQMKVFKTLSC